MLIEWPQRSLLSTGTKQNWPLNESVLLSWNKTRQKRTLKTQGKRSPSVWILALLVLAAWNRGVILVDAIRPLQQISKKSIIFVLLPCALCNCECRF